MSFMTFEIGIAIFKKQLTKPSFDLSSNLWKPSEKSLNFKKAAGLQSPVFSIRPRLSVKAVEYSATLLQLSKKINFIKWILQMVQVNTVS